MNDKFPSSHSNVTSHLLTRKSRWNVAWFFVNLSQSNKYDLLLLEFIFFFSSSFDLLWVSLCSCYFVDLSTWWTTDWLHQVWKTVSLSSVYSMMMPMVMQQSTETEREEFVYDVWVSCSCWWNNSLRGCNFLGWFVFRSRYDDDHKWHLFTCVYFLCVKGQTHIQWIRSNELDFVFVFVLFRRFVAHSTDK